MTFKAPPQLLERVLRFRAIQHKDDKVTLWGIPATISPNYSTVYMQRLLERTYGTRECASILYALGMMQGRAAFKIISERFGYAETYHDKKKLLEFEVGQGIVSGHGIINMEITDFDKSIFIGRGISPHAEEYKRFFGTQKVPVDHFLRGISSAYIEELIDKKVFCVENRCIGSGNSYCEFVVKPLKNWDKSDPNFKAQSIKKMPTMKELGAKIEPYIMLK